MKIKKTLPILITLALLTSTAFADTTPEFDAVGDDSNNFFIDPIKQAVVDNNVAHYDDTVVVNEQSSFAEEYFAHNLPSLPRYDPCFASIGEYESVPAHSRMGATYKWNIVLQYMPESDITVKINTCVLKPQGLNPWQEAAQTGRTWSPTWEMIFKRYLNPRITVTAHPGPYADQGVRDREPFHLESRTTPHLWTTTLDQSLFTSTGLWEQGIVIKLPETGDVNGHGETVYKLRQGDQIRIRIDIDSNHFHDIRYGKDNVILKYLGVVGSEYINQYRYK